MGLLFRPRRPLVRLATESTPALHAPDVEPAAELERLARLHDSGALTDHEFAAAKAMILGT